MPAPGDRLRFQTKALATDVVRLVDELNSRDVSTQVMARQLVRSATSVGANYRAAGRARSIREMYAKPAIVEEEADEVTYWLELLEESGKARSERLRPVCLRADEVVAMTVASKKTLAKKMERRAPGTDGRGSPSSTLDARHSTPKHRGPSS